MNNKLPEIFENSKIIEEPINKHNTDDIIDLREFKSKSEIIFDDTPRSEKIMERRGRSINSDIEADIEQFTRAEIEETKKEWDDHVVEIVF